MVGCTPFVKVTYCYIWRGKTDVFGPKFHLAQDRFHGSWQWLFPVDFRIKCKPWREWSKSWSNYVRKRIASKPLWISIIRKFFCISWHEKIAPMKFFHYFFNFLKNFHAAIDWLTRRVKFWVLNGVEWS